MGTVARTVVTAEITRIRDRYASQVRADAQNYQPLGVFRSNAVLLWIAKTRDVHLGLPRDFRLISENVFYEII